MRREQFRSPQHKLVHCFHRSRDQWRARAKAYHDQLRELKVRVRDVEASRDHWRAKYFERGGADAEPPLSGAQRRRMASAGTGAHGAGPHALRGGAGRWPGPGVPTVGTGARG